MPVQYHPMPCQRRCHHMGHCIMVLLYHVSSWQDLEMQDNINGTAHLKNVNNCLSTNNCSYLETSGGQSYNIYLSVVNFFNTNLN